MGVDIKGTPAVSIQGMPVCFRATDDCCTKVIKIVQGSAYGDGHFQWQRDENITGQSVSLRLQGQDFAGSASGRVATVPFTSAQTSGLEVTTHERSEYRLKVGDIVTVGRAEIL